MRLQDYIKSILLFFNTKYIIENNSMKSAAVNALMSQWKALMARIETLDTASPKISALVKSDFHKFILQLKKNINIFESNDKRFLMSLIQLLQAIRIGDIKTLLNSSISDVSSLGDIFNTKRAIKIHYPKGSRAKKEGEKPNLSNNID